MDLVSHQRSGSANWIVTQYNPQRAFTKPSHTWGLKENSPLAEEVKRSPESYGIPEGSQIITAVSSNAPEKDLLMLVTGIDIGKNVEELVALAINSAPYLIIKR